MSLMTIVLFVVGSALLIGGAELLVRGASRIALAAGVTPLVVGLTVVAFGTSSPELAVTVGSAWSGQPDVALGNVVGSNIFNILLILGISAMITPLIVAQQLVRIDVPLMIAASFAMLLFGLDGRLGRIDGLLLFAALIAYLFFLIRQSRRETAQVKAEYEEAFGADGQPKPGWLLNLTLIGVGLAMLVVGSNWLVKAAVSLATSLGVSELVIGLTIVAAGTSLPEVATSILAAVRGERDIAVGNAVGSNIFNILAVLGLGSAVSPNGVRVSQGALTFDIPVMIAVAVATLPIFFTGYLIGRWKGALMFGYYVAYTAWLVLDAAQHPVLSQLGFAMKWFVLPLTAITLVGIVVRALRGERESRTV